MCEQIERKDGEDAADCSERLTARQLAGWQAHAPQAARLCLGTPLSDLAFSVGRSLALVTSIGSLFTRNGLGRRRKTHALIRKYPRPT